MISVEKLFYSYGDGTRVLTDFSLHVEQGEFVAVVGRSGAGKSTLLHVLGGLDSHFTGDVRVAGQALAGRSDAQLARFRSETVGFVFQFFHLVPGLSALENVLLPSAFGGVRDEGKARAALVRVGLEGKEARLPGQLSGGERQRVAIARALFNEPRVLLCDEPTGNLDVQTAQEVIELFRKLNAEGLTIVAVTHEAQLREAASRVVDMVGAAAGAMNRAPGTVVSPTTPAGAQEATAGTAGADHTTPGVGARFIAPGVRTGTHGLSFSALRRLVSLQLRRDKRAALTSAFGVAVGIGALVFFVALGLGVGRVVRDKVFPVDASLIEVVPSQLSLGMFGGKLDQSAVDRLAAMEGVKAAHRKQLVKVPAVSF